MRKFSLLVNVLLFLFPITIHSQSEADLADSLYYAAKDLYYDGEYLQAKKGFESALAIWIKLHGENHEKVGKGYYRLAKTEKKLRYNKMALTTLQKSAKITANLYGEESEKMGDLYLEFGDLYDQMFDMKNAQISYHRCIKIFEKKYDRKHPIVGNVLMNIGLAQMKMGNYRDAELYFQRALSIFKKSSEPNSEDFNRIYNNLGYLYRKVGDYDKSIEYGRKALEIKLLNYKETHPSVSKYYSNIGKAYARKGEYEKGLVYAKKAVALQEKSVGKDHPETAGSYTELANFYADMGRSQEALELYQKGVSIMEKRLSPTHPYVVGTYENIGHVYEDMQAYDKALDFYRQALQKYFDHEYVVEHFVAQTYFRIGIVFLETNQIDSALFNVGKGMEFIASNFTYRVGDETINPQLSQVQNEVDFLDLLNLKSEILEQKYKNTKQQKDLEDALHTIEYAVKLIEKMRRSYQSEASKQDLNERVAWVFQLAVRVAFKMYQLTEDPLYLMQSLNFSEKSKASILWQNMNTNFALKNAGIPDGELERLKKLGFEIKDLEEQIFEADETSHTKLQSKLFDLKLKYEDQVVSLDQYNAKYFQLKYASPQVDLDNLQRKILDAKTALVEFFYDENNIYTFVIFKDKIKGFQHPFSSSLEKSIQYLRDFNVKDYTRNASFANEKYISELNFLYESLWKNIAEQVESVEQLVIVPHGVLNYLSFEILAPKSSASDFRKLPYLLKKHNIHYAWSLSLWEKDDNQKVNFRNDFLGFAPSFNTPLLADNSASSITMDRSLLSELDFSQMEIKHANTYFEGSIFLGDQASEFSFQQYAPDSKVLHLATHAIADDRQPMYSGLVFSQQKDTIEDGFLNAYEIYNLHLPAELAVMSACNTGFGKLAAGEGVISLGRAFSYAGCKSVLMSLWMANDQSTTQLMNTFYKNLARGQRKDQALKNAKLTYLENADPLTAHPYFWASMVAIGDMESLSAGRDFSYWAIALGVFIALLFWGIRFFSSR
ncbi:MAG: CHAT domain-containing tetratricopeptide repeat protein [Bacteroidota bacterium]